MSIWDDERNITYLEREWNSGSSASVIGGKLGISASAVVSKVNRLRETGTRMREKLLKRPGNDNPTRRYHKSQAVNSPYLCPDKWQALDGAEPVALMDLEPHHCRWPIGDPVEGFCGKPKERGSYCGRHASESVQTVSIEELEASL